MASRSDAGNTAIPSVATRRFGDRAGTVYRGLKPTATILRSLRDQTTRRPAPNPRPRCCRVRNPIRPICRPSFARVQLRDRFIRTRPKKCGHVLDRRTTSCSALCTLARLRYSLAEAEAEAMRLAIEYVQSEAKWPGAVFRRARPSPFSPTSASSKHPVVWTAYFDLPWPGDIVVDGGELMFDVDIETKVVRQWGVG
jgi:hypothetical protein